MTGGHGFLGSHLVQRLVDEEWVVQFPTSRDVDLRSEASLRSVEGAFDVIFHLAAWTQAGDWCVTHPGEQWIVNQQINTNAVSWWKEYHHDALFVAMGTSCSYAPGSELVETKYMAGEPIESLYTYALTKRMLLQGLRAISRQFGGRYLYAVPSTLYGPGYHTDGRQMHFIFDLVRKILRGRDLGEQVILWGDGYQRRELVHVDDFVTNLLGLVQNGAEDIFNLGAGRDFTIREFAEQICIAAGFDPSDIIYDTSRYVGASEKKLSTVKVEEALMEYVQRPLDRGIGELVQWFEDSRAYL